MQAERREQKACVLEYVAESKKERELSDLRNGTINTPPFFMIDALTPMKKCGLSFTELEDILKDLREELFIEKYVSRDSEWMGTDFQVFPQEHFDITYIKFLKESEVAQLAQPVRLSDVIPTFDTDLATISLGERRCKFPHDGNEHSLCRVMYSHSKGVPVDWSIVFEEMNHFPGILNKRESKKSDRKSIQDTMYAVNKRVCKDIHTPDKLLSWENNTITRKF